MAPPATASDTGQSNAATDRNPNSPGKGNAKGRDKHDDTHGNSGHKGNGTH
jgi:hypothetical protein